MLEYGQVSSPEEGHAVYSRHCRHNSSGGRRNPARSVAIVTLVAATGCSVGIAGIPPARAASAPVLRISLYNGPQEWTGWRSYLDTKGNRECRVRVAAPASTKVRRVARVNGRGHFAWPQNYLPAGRYRLQVTCPNTRSAAVSFYSPRNRMNDARTMFSDYTQGVLGV